MNIGILLPGFSASKDDWAIPVQQNLVRVIAKDDDVRVISLRYPHTRTPYRIYGATVYPLGVGAWVRGWRRLALWWDALRLIQRLHDEKRFDVLHAMWADETGLIAGWAGKVLNVPVVVSVAGGELVGFPDIGYGLQNSAFGRWTVGQALHRANAVVVACRYTKRLIAEAGYGVPDRKIHTVTLGVDLNVFKPNDTPLRMRHLVHVASLVGVKDQVTLLKAVAKVKNVTLDIVGEGPELEKLRQMVRDLEINERVAFVGKISHLDLPQVYQGAALNILTSRHEGLGMVSLEAGACRVPTISTDVGLLTDCPELGFVVPVGDALKLAHEIENILSDTDRRSQLAESAYQRVINGYSIEHTAERLLSLYAMIQ